MRGRVARRGAALTGALVVGVALATSGTPALAASGTVSGTVFQDYDSNGVLDTGGGRGTPVDRGLAGVLVTAVDRDQTVVGTARSGPDGTYTVNVTGADTDDVRLVFSDLPDGYEPSYSVLAAGAGDSGSDVQLARLGDTDVDFGVNAPDDYSTAGIDTPTVTPIHYAAQRTNPYAADWPSLIVYPWQDDLTDASQAPGFNLPTGPDVPGGTPAAARANYFRNGTFLATTQQTGALWGVATQRSTGDVFASALLKRSTDLGPLGIGGIYRVPTVMDPATGEIGTPGAVEQWLDVSTLAPVAPAGLDLSAAGRGLTADPNAPGDDPLAFQNAGKVGIGGMAVSTDQTKLYAVDLYTQQLLVIDIASKSLDDAIDLGLGATDRPWAVHVHHGQVYVGYVSDSTSATTTMRAVVRSAPESDLGALSSGTTALSIPMDYLKGLPWERPNRLCTSSPPPDPDPREQCLWHPWTDTFDADDWGIEIEGAQGISHAQPILSDIDFTPDGDLVVGLQDRLSLQTGQEYYGPNGETNASGGTFEAYSNGDTLVAAPDGDGTFTLEDDGTVGGKTTASTRAEGPGGGEFFDDTNVYSAQWDGTQWVTTTPVHHETTTGALATLPGVDQLLSTAFDPGGQYRVNGFSWFSTQDGSRADARNVAGQSTGAALKKAGGLGDVATLLPLAPLQIGNVVWFDADQDGIQDADEPPLPGVTVDLLDAGGATIATTTTDANGQYYFATDDPDITGFDPDGGDYTVRFVPPTTGDAFSDDARFGTLPWSDLSFTTQDAGSNDSVDSDADPSSGEVPYTAGAPGENDPTIDAGLIADVSTTVTKLVEDMGLWVDPDATYTITVHARDFRGDPLPSTTLTLRDGDTAAVPIAPDTWPAGTQIELTESGQPSFDLTVDPSGWTVVSDGTPQGGFTATNTRVPSTGFEITKDVQDPGGLVPDGTTYTGTWQCTYPDDSTVVGSGTWTLTGGDSTTVATDLPVGATCTVTETPPADVDDGDWEPPDVSGTITLGPGGTTVPVVTVTNALTPSPTPTPTPTPSEPTASPSTPAPTPTPTPPGQIATTGADAVPPLLVGLGLLLVGAIFLLVARRRS